MLNNPKVGDWIKLKQSSDWHAGPYKIYLNIYDKKSILLENARGSDEYSHLDLDVSWQHFICSFPPMSEWYEPEIK